MSTRNCGLWWRSRSSTIFLGCVAFIATFTDGFIYSAIVPVLPFSLVSRSGVLEDDVQFWLSLMLISYGLSFSIGSIFAGYTTTFSTSLKSQFLFSLFLAFFSTTLFCVSLSPVLYVLARAIQGLSGGFVYLIAMVLIADHVDPTTIGAWIGFVFTGMNVGLLIGPFLGGVVYDREGYYALFGLIMAIIAVDFLLMIAMVEKPDKAETLENSERPIVREELNANEEMDSGVASQRQEDPESAVQDEPTDETPLLFKTQKPASSFATAFPGLHSVINSPRLRASILGGCIHMGLQTAFDAVLPLFVKRNFHWSSTNAGLMFLTITIPSLSGTIVGAMADRYGTRKTAVFGFLVATPSIAAMGFVENDTLSEKIGLCVILSFVGIGINFLIGPLVADVFKEAESLAERNPTTITKTRAFAQSVSIFNSALGVAMAFGPGVFGAVYEVFGWRIMSGVMAGSCALGGVYVFLHTGNNGARERKGDSEV